MAERDDSGNGKVHRVQIDIDAAKDVDSKQ